MLVVARFLILPGRATLGGSTRVGARCRFEDEEAEAEVSREGEGQSSSDVSVSGLESGEEGGG